MLPNDRSSRARFDAGAVSSVGRGECARAMTEDQAIRDRVLAVLKQIAPEVDAASVDPAASFRDQFGIDSIDFLNFVVGLEDSLGVRIDEADHPWLSSLNGCVAYLSPRRERQERAVES